MGRTQRGGEVGFDTENGVPDHVGAAGEQEDHHAEGAQPVPGRPAVAPPFRCDVPAPVGDAEPIGPGVRLAVRSRDGAFTDVSAVLRLRILLLTPSYSVLPKLIRSRRAVHPQGLELFPAHLIV